jgi:hypothetical protein
LHDLASGIAVKGNNVYNRKKAIGIIVVEQPIFPISILHARIPVAPDALPIFMATLDSFLST